MDWQDEVALQDWFDLILNLRTVFNIGFYTFHGRTEPITYIVFLMLQKYKCQLGRIPFKRQMRQTESSLQRNQTNNEDAYALWLTPGG